MCVCVSWEREETWRSSEREIRGCPVCVKLQNTVSLTHTHTQREREREKSSHRRRHSCSHTNTCTQTHRHSQTLTTNERTAKPSVFVRDFAENGQWDNFKNARKVENCNEIKRDGNIRKRGNMNLKNWRRTNRRPPGPRSGPVLTRSPSLSLSVRLCAS